MAPAETPAAFLRIAHRDLQTVMAMADSSVFAEDSWGFYLQQATEKALKAWLLLLLPEQPPFTHNLRLLFQMLGDSGADIEPFRALSRFTLFAVLRRYDEEPDVEDLDRDTWSQRCAEWLRRRAAGGDAVDHLRRTLAITWPQ
jgi:HEPN domain-containing protein